MYPRSIPLPRVPKTSFFLWGPRQTGKSTLLRTLYPKAPVIDLLETDQFLRYSERPAWLREEILAKRPPFVILDEVQTVPLLLQEVHWLIERAGTVFGLCGSSARKVRRGHANLLGGRAIRYELFGLTSAELGPEFSITRILNNGALPPHYDAETDDLQKKLGAYVNNYLREEVLAEGLVRKLPAFSNFLSLAALSDTELLSYATIARDCAVAKTTVQGYYQILLDTLLGRLIPAYRKRAKRRTIHAPKFYFADVGIVNYLAKRGKLEPGGELFGKALENWVCHELSAYLSYRERSEELSYWRLASGTEVDFIVGDMACAIEVKATRGAADHHLRGLRSLAKEHHTQKSILVSLDAKTRKTEDGITILPVEEFAKALWANELF